MMRRKGLGACAIFLLCLSPHPTAAKVIHPVASELVAAAAAATSSSESPVTHEPNTPSDSISRPDLIALTQPSIVRILTHFKGTVAIPTFKVNLETLTWSTVVDKPDLVPYDTDFLGSGFIISSDGSIVTNSHVVSGATLTFDLARELAAGIVIERALGLTGSENARLEALNYSSVQYQKLVTDGVSYIMSRLPSINPTSITVLRPDVQLPATTTSAFDTQILNSTNEALQKQIAALIQAGVPATVTSVNNAYVDDEKDVAIIQVNETGLPAINLGSDSAIQVGESIYVFGFPSSADINGFNGEPSITGGAVNALQDSTQHTFKYIQTDAKVSTGSSGGPMIDVTGAVIGVLTLQSSGNSGDSFAFAVPISLVKSVVSASSTSSNSDDYGSHFLLGLSLEETRHCRAATAEFNAAATANPIFGSVVPYVKPHIDACAALIASGRSIDSLWDEILNGVEQLGATFWVVLFAGVLFIGGLILVILYLMRRMRRGEVAMLGMSERQNHVTISSSGSVSQMSSHPEAASAGTETPLTPAATTNPEMVAFIAQARRSGQVDSQIAADLRSVGWDESTIDTHLAMRDGSTHARIILYNGNGS